ncbi:heme ABC transporter ATP-binding protein [Sinorhizobium americanum]|uniref:Hemin import ATP-binding protein HmuV n=1 Tax=Sinorhizobium americanum TaxID=194963 RepID=A0A1L3LPQ5_9HYPH|nr:heme ABC transporter ATP-binding protein [Sinorhizobium americanum]APG85413.1 hemin import ATP-binding protein HmuV [Sinorhizobium americanum CCGM7]APG92071.1 hemin import ATP-binding protein HmuV [Sinorhizobium americanum]OAP34776.1 iron ABC transporter [Sinorhizobium americanum]
MIRASDISVRLAGRPVLHGVSFEAAPGTMTAIVGPNGSGKTTTLKAISGELQLSKGKVTINGDDIARLKPFELALKRGVLPQSTIISFPFTVREIVGLGLSTGGADGGGNGRTVDEALEAVDLAGFSGRFYQELSGGEQQRVQLARVLCQIAAPVGDGEPRYLLLDEPVSSLDIRHQLTIMQLARQFCEGGGGVIAVMHDLNLTAMFADQMVMMKVGRIRALGAPKEVLTDETMEAVFGCRMRVGIAPARDVPFVLPQTASL